MSKIHGDLHLGNILIGPAGDAWLIDFEWTRLGHTLLDWAGLEAAHSLRAAAHLRPSRHSGHTLDDVTPTLLPPGLLEELTTRLQRHTLWRRVREELESRVS